MKEQLVSFETAKLAKERGFKIKQSYGFYWEDRLTRTGRRGLPPFGYAPTQSLLQKWLRSVYDIHIRVDYFLDETDKIEWDYEISIIGTDINEKGEYSPLVPFSENHPVRKFKDYSQALEGGLQEGLQLTNLTKY